MDQLSQRLIDSDLRVAQLENAIESLARAWRKTIDEHNKLKADKAEWVAALEAATKHAKVMGDRNAAAVGYCKRHTHSGVTISAHVCLLEVLKILEGRQNEATEVLPTPR